MGNQLTRWTNIILAYMADIFHMTVKFVIQEYHQKHWIAWNIVKRVKKSYHLDKVVTILIYRSRSWSADHFLIWSEITFYHFSRSRSWSDRRSLFYWSWSDFKITFFQITQFWQGLSISKNSTFSCHVFH